MSLAYRTFRTEARQYPLGFPTWPPSGVHCSASPKFHPLIVNPLNFGWNETRGARLLVIRIQNIVGPAHGKVWILECVPTAICDEALRSLTLTSRNRSELP